ncbi:MAG: SusC/RagA family TonB-linked outer membrane protein, partial [Mucilaginibacter sp.]
PAVSNAVVAQTVTGKVTDDKGETLIGVSVTEKGTRNAVVTDINGNYRISVAGPASTLVFTYVGHGPVEVVVGNKSTVNVTLVAQANALTDVVVTALGIKREAKKLGYSTTSVNTADLTTERQNNVMTSLEGKVAGLNISPPSAGAGSSTRIRLRGQSAFNGTDNSPLIVLNGLPFNQSAQGASGNNSVDNGDALLQINQDDIETMTVLKGSTAAALYGSRAANGAIMITTKSGSKNSKFGVEFSSSFAADQALDYNNFQTQYGFGTGGNKPANIGQAISSGQYNWGALNDGSPVIQFDGISRPYAATQTTHQRILDYYRMGQSYTNSLAFTGGNASTSYRMSYSNQDALGISPVNDYHRKVFNIGLNSKITDKLNTTFNLNYALENNNNSPQVGVQGAGAPNFLYRMSNDIPLSAFQQSAVDPGGYERVSSGFGTTLLNPYYQNPIKFDKTNRDRVLATITARYDFYKFLYLQGRINYDYSNSFNENNTPTGLGSGGQTLLNGAKTAYNGGYATSTNYGKDVNMDFLLGTNNQKIGDFTVEGTLGGNTRTSDSRGFNESVTDLNVFGLYSIGNGVTKNLGYGIGRSKVNSLYGVADFGYKNFLYLSVTDRVDWYSVLTYPTGNKNYYNYPSISGSFVFSELLPNISWLNYGKLRASWASTGSTGPVGAFGGLITYNLSTNPYTTSNGSYTLGGYSGTDPNPYIQTFGVTEKEIGLEVRTLDSRLNFDITAYNKETTKQLLTVPLTSASGFSSVQQNLGSMRNRGLEILVEGTPVKTANFTYTTSFNSAFNESVVTSLGAPSNTRLQVANFGGNEFIGSLYYQVGMALNQLGGRTYARDANGNVMLTSSGRLINNSSDVLFGSADPKWTGGWNNTFRYKKLSMSVFIDYKLGNKILSSTALNGLRQGLTQASLVGRVGGVVFPGVLPGGTPNNIGVDPQTFYTDYRNLQIVDPFLYNGGFIKLRNISLSYDFTGMIAKNVKFIKGLSLSASCRNVLLIKKWIPDVDPESFASSGDSRLGYEQTSLPTTRTYGLNLNVKF